MHEMNGVQIFRCQISRPKVQRVEGSTGQRLKWVSGSAGRKFNGSKVQHVEGSKVKRLNRLIAQRDKGSTGQQVQHVEGK